jgi:hypothetical protein
MVTSASNRERGVSIVHNQAPDLRVFVVGRTDGHTPLDQGHPRVPRPTPGHPYDQDLDPGQDGARDSGTVTPNIFGSEESARPHQGQGGSYACAQVIH